MFYHVSTAMCDEKTRYTPCSHNSIEIFVLTYLCKKTSIRKLIYNGLTILVVHLIPFDIKLRAMCLKSRRILQYKMLRYWSHCLFPEIHCLTTKRDVGIDVVVRCFDNVSHDF